MSSWFKLLAQMVADPKPVGYTYYDAARVLEHLGFTLASKNATSHRKWRLERLGLPGVTVGLVERGHGPIKKSYIVDMISTLRENNLLPEGVE